MLVKSCSKNSTWFASSMRAVLLVADAASSKNDIGIGL